MPTPPPLPPPLNTMPFHIREAALLNVPPARLRRSDLGIPFRGIRTSFELSTLDDRCLAYLPRLRENQWFSHATAALLWGMWLPLRVQRDSAIHVSSAWPAREPRMRGVVGHRVAIESVTLDFVRGMPVLSPSDCWTALSAGLSLDELVIAGDSVLRRQAPLAVIGELVEALVRHEERRGASLLTRALPLLRARTDSAREVELRLLLIRSGLPEPLVNLSIVDAVGEMFGDLAYPDWHVLVEYDGRHHLTDAQIAADILRHERLAAAGWTVVRVVNAHFSDPGGVVSRVARALVNAGWRPPRSKLQLMR
ncbi:MAG: DUF559 domain-containing protein [Salinibacterium sp.]|nr:DUF559 domain-containing protein [Salinibacterium sp.]